MSVNILKFNIRKHVTLPLLMLKILLKFFHTCSLIVGLNKSGIEPDPNSQPWSKVSVFFSFYLVQKHQLDRVKCEVYRWNESNKVDTGTQEVKWVSSWSEPPVVWNTLHCRAPPCLGPCSRRVSATGRSRPPPTQHAALHIAHHARPLSPAWP